MKKTNIYEIVLDLLKTNTRYVSEDGKLLKSVVFSDVMTMKTDLIELLISNDKVKDTFFIKVNDMYIFDKQGFSWFIESKEFLPDSYTKFSNKIGLSLNGNYLSQNNDVVLDFPFKDCVLEGGQTKEDQKRDEIFFNEIIASDDISRMLYPKVFTNIKKINSKGFETDIKYNGENLVIKGNNLISLASLSRRFNNKVKCVYIDVPYNTGNDSFGYNDKFNHSTWLCFMKNRLMYARDLLCDSGTIAISVDNYELGYLLVLLDEIFGKENRKNIITVRRASASGAKVINPGVVNIVEYVVLYSKNTTYWKPNRVYASKSYDERYNSYITNIDDNYENWKFTTVLNAFADSLGIAKNKLKSHFGDNYDIELENFVIEHADNVVRLAALDDKQISNETRELKKISKENPEKIIYQKREGYKDYYLINGNAILFAKDRLIEVDGNKTFSSPITDIWDDVLPNDLHNEGGVELKKGKKPEKLISRIIELCSNENDIIVDFFAGSGTTGAVAMKMNRKFILCEQMDYIEDITSTRLENVISGENRGVSALYNWQGGGEFIYCELKEFGYQLIHKIQSANNDNINKIKDEIFNDERIIPYVTQKQLQENSDLFDELNFDEKKELLISLVDKNKLYVNVCDMDDENYKLSEEEIKFTKSFYEGV